MSTLKDCRFSADMEEINTARTISIARWVLQSGRQGLSLICFGMSVFYFQ